MKARFLAAFLMIVGLFITGCNDQRTYVIHDALVPEVGDLLKDYAGLNGFRVLYANEDHSRASFRIYVETTSVVVPAEERTVYQGNRHRHTHSHKHNDDDRTRYSNAGHYSSVRTVQRPAEVVHTDWTFTVVLNQVGDDVRVRAESSGGYNPGRHVRGFVSLLEYEGLTLAEN